MAIPVLVPLINPNEPEAKLVSVNIVEGQRVLRGEVLCTLETTKSTSELVAEIDGYILGLQYKSGDSVTAGDLFCHLADSNEPNPVNAKIRSKQSPGREEKDDIHPDVLPEGLRITQPALDLAKQYQLDLAQLPFDTLITERYIQKLLEKNIPASSSLSVFDPTKVIIYGGGGHCKSLIELLRSLGNLRIHGIIDDKLAVGTTVLGCPVLGGEDSLSEMQMQGIRLAVNAVGGIGNIQSRVNVFERLIQSGFTFPILIHPSAFVESSARLSPGVQVFPHAYIGSEAQVGFGAIINTGAVISHDCSVGDYANISPGALLAGGVLIGDRALVGMGVTINLRVSVGPNARIGNSTTVKEDVPSGHVLRAGSVWPE